MSFEQLQGSLIPIRVLRSGIINDTFFLIYWIFLANRTWFTYHVNRATLFAISFLFGPHYVKQSSILTKLDFMGEVMLGMKWGQANISFPITDAFELFFFIPSNKYCVDLSKMSEGFFSCCIINCCRENMVTKTVSGSCLDPIVGLPFDFLCPGGLCSIRKLTVSVRIFSWKFSSCG